MLGVLTNWVAGFRKSSHGRPYLLSEEHRVVLFPRAASSSVVSLEKAAPVLEAIRANLDELIGVDRIDLVPMVQGREDEVGGAPIDSGSTTFRADPASAASSDKSFPGFPSDPILTSLSSPGASGSISVGPYHIIHSCPPKDKKTKRPIKAPPVSYTHLTLPTKA